MKTQTVRLLPGSGSHFSLRKSTYTELGAPREGTTGPEAKEGFNLRVGAEASSSEEEIVGAEGLAGDALRP